MNDIDLTSLTEDGDRLDLTDRLQLRLTIGPDEMYSVFDDGDWYGKLEWEDRRRTNEYGYPMRPDGFDGRARKIQTRDGVVWWQPAPDITDIEAFRRDLVDALEYGYSYVSLDLWEKLTDSLGGEHWVRQQGAGIGGVGPSCDHNDIAEIVSDLACELTYQQETVNA